VKVLFVSAFSQNGLESGANRLRKLASGIERNGGKVSWIHPKEDVNKFRASFDLVRAANSWLMNHRDGVCLISLPPPWLVVPAFILALLWRTRVWLDFRDPLLNQTINPRPLYFRAVMGFLQNVAVTKSGGCIHASSRIPEMLGIDGRRSEIVYAGVEPSELAKIRNLPVEKKAGFHFVYGGTFYGSRSPVILLDALEIIKAKSAHPLFTLYCNFNSADEERRFKALVSERGLGDFISFQPLLPRNKFLAVLKNADCNLLITHGQGSEYAIPGKIYDYIMAERPILAISSDVELKDFARRFSVKMQFADPSSATEVAEAILKQMLGSNVEAQVSPDLMCDVQAKKFLNLSFAPHKS
jgi:glycosyltransferase involved in cell wall biosynthesis